MRNVTWAVVAVLGIALGGCNETDEEEYAYDETGNGIPKITGVPKRELTIEEMYDFEPTAQDAENQSLSFAIENKPEWAYFDKVTGRLWGQPTIKDVGLHPGIIIKVTDGAATASLPSFAVTVHQVGEGSVLLTWDAPTTYEDGSPMNDLAGFRLYYGTKSRQYSNEIRIDNPGTNSYVVENLGTSTYFFAATAVTEAGMESDYSAEAVRALN